MKPVSGSSERGATITIVGDMFRPSNRLGCRVGNVYVPATFRSTNSISCTAQGPVLPGSVEIAVTDNGVDFVGVGNFTFLPEATVTTLNPSSGPLSGGVTVVLQGTGFSAIDKPCCSFGGVVVAAEVFSPTEARCVTPFMRTSLSTPLSKPVAFSNNGVTFDDEAADGTLLGPTFTFYREPLVSSLVPSGGVTNGPKTTVAVTGVYLAKHGTTVADDNRLACRLRESGGVTIGVVVSSTEATCVVECGDYAGRTSLEVSLNGGVHWTASDAGFRCDPLPMVTSIDPPIGVDTGGTTLTIRGSGFVPSASLSCFIPGGQRDPTLTPGTWISSSVMECLTPAGEGPATSSVHVSNDGVNFSPQVPSAMFDYVPSPTVWRVTPSFASVSGNGPPVVVTGTNFVNSSISSCHFTSMATESADGAATGGLTVAATFLSSTEISCPVPSDASLGPTLLTVSVNGVDSGHSGAVIDVEALPEVHQIVPARGLAGDTVKPLEVSVPWRIFTPSKCIRIDTSSGVVHAFTFALAP